MNIGNRKHNLIKEYERNCFFIKKKGKNFENDYYKDNRRKKRFLILITLCSLIVLILMYGVFEKNKGLLEKKPYFFVTILNEKGQKILIRENTVYKKNGKMTFFIFNIENGNYEVLINDTESIKISQNYFEIPQKYFYENDLPVSLVFSYKEKGKIFSKRKFSQVFYILDKDFNKEHFLTKK
jgi:hypothetical protein